MCRRKFDPMKLTPYEAEVTGGQLQVWSVEFLLRDLDVSNCRKIKGCNIFKRWAEKHRQWFWNAFDTVKENYYRRVIFLFLTKATVASVVSAGEAELKNAKANFGITGGPETRERMIKDVLAFIIQRLSPSYERATTSH